MKKTTIIKKAFALALTVTMLLGTTSLAGLSGLDLFDVFVAQAEATGAEELTEGLYKYTVSDNKATITGRTNLIGDITIPSTLGGYTVVAIGDNALKTAGGINSVTIPESIEVIGENAFYACGKLKSVVFKDNSNLTAIGIDAFANCTLLETIDFGQNNMVKELGGGVFANCKSLESIVIPESIEIIGYSAFEGCSALKKINIPKNVSVIGDSVFALCSALEAITVSQGNENYAADGNGVLFSKDKTKLIVYPAANSNTEYIIPMSVTQVEKAAFRGQKHIEKISWENSNMTLGISAFSSCEKLTCVDIPEGFTHLTDWAFTSCINLKNVNLPDSLESMGSGVFHDCKSLETIDLSPNIELIPDNCFSLCISLKEIVIPDSVTNIRNYAFRRCDSLKTVTIGKGLKTIGTDIFAETKSLENIIVSEDNPYCLSENGAFYDQDKSFIVQYACAREEKVFIIPDTVTMILPNAFKGNKNLEAVVIPAGVTKIGYGAFCSISGADYTSGITDIYYGGSENDWNAIEGIHSVFDNSDEIKIHYDCGLKIEETPPTSKNDGERKLFCNCCGNLITTEVLPATGPIIAKNEEFDVSASYDDDCFKEKVNFSVTKVKESDMEKEKGSVYFADEKSSYYSVSLFTIKMLNDKSDAIQPNDGKYVTLKMPIPDGYKDRTNFMIIHWFTGGGYEKFSTDDTDRAWIENGYIYFKTGKFSEFGIYVKSNVSLKKTPDSTVCAYKGELDLKGIELEFTDSTGSVRAITDTSQMRIEGLDSTKLGKQTVKIYYGEDFAELDVTVKYTWWQWIIRILFLGVFWY